MIRTKVQKSEEEPDGAHTWRTKSGNDRIVKKGPPQNNRKKSSKKNQTLQSAEEGSQHNPESDVETTNECVANENETNPHHIKCDEHFQNDTTADKRNGTTHKANFARQSSLDFVTKLSYFNLFTRKCMKDCLTLTTSKEPQEI